MLKVREFVLVQSYSISRVDIVANVVGTICVHHWFGHYELLTRARERVRADDHWVVFQLVIGLCASQNARILTMGMTHMSRSMRWH